MHRVHTVHRLARRAGPRPGPRPPTPTELLLVTLRHSNLRRPVQFGLHSVSRRAMRPSTRTRTDSCPLRRAPSFPGASLPPEAADAADLTPPRLTDLGTAH